MVEVYNNYNYVSFTGIEVRLSYYRLFTTLKRIDNVICNGAEQQLSDCSYDFHVTLSQRTFRMECEYCEYSPIIIA